jgi:peptidoglycan hydrolase-like protein with peptidoglycan-binding domain
MRSNQLRQFGILLLTVVLGMSAFASPNATKQATSAKSQGSRLSRLRKASWKHRGQQQIQTDRAREIQEALIREHYLDGQPTGVWDAKTLAAMRRFQADQGWQSKVVPDSRALIKLGLGPSHENDLNPDLMGDKAVAPTFRGTESAPADVSQR